MVPSSRTTSSSPAPRSHAAPRRSAFGPSRVVRLATGALVAGVLAACAGGRGRPPVVRPQAPDALTASTVAGRPTPGRTPLTVVNRYRADVVVFVARVGEGVLTRLGTVAAAGRARFALPERFVGDPAGVYLVADPIGAGRMASERVLVGPRQRMEWTLESGLERSMLAVY